MIDLSLNWHKIDDYSKGQKIGYIIGKYGVEIFAPLGAIKGFTKLNALKRANTGLTLEMCLSSSAKQAKILEKSSEFVVKREAIAQEAIKKSGLLFRNGNDKIHIMQPKHAWDKLIQLYLAELCSMTWRDKEAFELHIQTYNKFSDPPEAVLIAMARCRNSPPGSPSIADEEAEKLLKLAFGKKPSYGAALMLKSLYYTKGNSRQEKYWEAMCQEAEMKNIHSEKIIPNIFNEKIAM